MNVSTSTVFQVGQIIKYKRKEKKKKATPSQTFKDAQQDFPHSETGQKSSKLYTLGSEQLGF